jgi:hypothetical protein
MSDRLAPDGPDGPLPIAHGLIMHQTAGDFTGVSGTAPD